MWGQLEEIMNDAYEKMNWETSGQFPSVAELWTRGNEKFDWPKCMHMVAEDGSEEGWGSERGSKRGSKRVSKAELELESGKEEDVSDPNPSVALPSTFGVHSFIPCVLYMFPGCNWN
jgi:hypothetical protein